MEVVRLAIPEVVRVEPRLHRDGRGFFLERHKASAYRNAGLPERFVQINHSRSVRGTLRGLHFQKAAAAQGKLVGCVSGEVLDVAVDLRRGSPTFGRWASARLSGENGHQLWVPAGFGHGFAVLSDSADLVYFVSGSEYSPEHDRGVRWDDPAIGIDWELSDPLLSEKDALQPLLADADIDFVYREER
jgi:dTDP-4-dehydrorhamnose 3,5-epimerase